MPPNDVAWYRLTYDPDGALGTDPRTRRRLGTSARPFAHTPTATSLLLAVLIDDQPSASIDDIAHSIHYDPELARIIDDYRSHGWGHLTARTIFRNSTI